MARARHPKKEVEEAFGHAEQAGWVIASKASGHAWGKATCPTEGGCVVSIWSTPKSAGNHKKDIIRKVDRCQH